MERFSKSLKTRVYKYFTKNTCHYLDVIDILLTVYNSIHSTKGMPPINVKHCLWVKIHQIRVKFKTGDLVRITKGMVKFAKDMNKPFQQRYFEFPMLFSACPNMFTN